MLSDCVGGAWELKSAGLIWLWGLPGLRPKRERWGASKGLEPVRFLQGLQEFWKFLRQSGLSRAVQV